jgi:rhomboid domain-containing protein 1
MLPLLALQAAIEFYRLERKPPVTAGLLAANTLIYLRPSFLHSILPSIDEVWFNPHLILRVCVLTLINLSSSRVLQR